MNDCLLVIWICKIIKREDSLWCDLYKKYMTNCDFFSSKSQEAPNFGKGYKRLTIFFHVGVIHKMGNGKQTKFWNDVWLDDAD
jgi:hypothetical protein